MTESEQDAGHRVVPAVSRRAMLFGAGAVGAVGVLAACGAEVVPSAPAPTTATGAGTTPSGPTSAGATSAAGGGGAADPNAIKAADIPVGGGKIFPERQLVVTQPTAGQFKAFDATCTHQQCLVGSVSNGKIRCPCHGSQFNIADGSVAQGPANRPLAQKNATEANGSITIG